MRLVALPLTILALAVTSPLALAQDAGKPAPTPAPTPTPQAPTAAISGEVVVLQASNTGKGISPDLSAYAADLGKPPLNGYNTYSLVKRDNVALQPLKATSMTIPNNVTVGLTYKSIIPATSPTTQPKYEVQVSVQRGNGSTVVNLTANAKPGNQLFLVTSEKYQDGYLVIGIKVK